MAENECPQSVDEAVNRLIGVMDVKEIDDAYLSDKSSFTIRQHFSLGLYVRNNFGINDGKASKLISDIIKIHGMPLLADDVSGVILDELWEEIQRNYDTIMENKRKGDTVKVRDGIIGLLIGDALGVPVEFVGRETLEANPVTGMRGHGTYDMPKGTWSDDTSMTLATMESIANKGKIDYEDIMNEFSLFANEGKHCQYGVFDYGGTTIDAIYNFDDGVPALECGGTGERDNGNGSLMRILPMAFIPGVTYEEIENVSGLTHAHMRSKIACVLYIEIAKSMLENDLEISEHIKRSCDRIKEHYAGSSELEHFQRIFENDLDEVESSGYVMKTLECVLHCLLNTSSYSEAVLKAVNFGRDTDTVGAICGGLAGIYYGFDDIPSEWIDSVPQIEGVFDLCDRFSKVCQDM